MKISYLLEVPTIGDPNPVADGLIACCPVPVDSSGVGENRAFVRFRAESDEEARQFAFLTRPGIDYLLSKGYGVHRRIVTDYVSGEKTETDPGGVVQ